ncbi:MAG: mechanosensitive ion channel family protein [Mesorhizobium sp.]|nr:mechanosensitive ion channel family protein [Mesorhizobium sp.]
MAAVIVLLCGLGPAAAQDMAAAPAVPQIVQEMQPVIDGLAKRAEELSKRVDANAQDDARLVELRLELERIASEALAAGVAFRPRLTEINTRLELLGPVPAEGQPAEAEIVANERMALLREKSQINVLIGAAETTSLGVNRQIGRIAQLRRDLFASTLSKRYDINYALVGEVLDGLRSESTKFTRVVTSWLRFVIQFKLSSVLAATFFALAGAAILLIGGRRLFGNLIVPDPAEADPPYISRLSVAFWSTLLRSASISVFLAGTWYFFNYFNVLRGDIGAMLWAFFVVIASTYFVRRLAMAALSPKRPNWRLVEIESRPAGVLVLLITLTAIVSGADFFLTRVFATMGSPLSLTVGESLVATVIVGVLVVLIGHVKPRVNADGTPRPWPVWLRLSLYLLGSVTLAAALLGYIGFSRFMSQQIVVTGAILAMMYIGILSARAISEEGAFAGTALGRRLEKRFQVEEAGFDQLALVTSMLVNLLVFVVGVPLILLQWGFQWGDIRAWAYSLAHEIRIGTVSFSLIGIVTGIAVFAIGYYATRWFQRWLDGTVMARGRVDAGVRNSIRTAVGYAGVAIAGLIGISAAGIDLSSLALVAGALSLGIGFGLQNVVSNFVSGLILLAERPFKVGDWIIAGPVSGTVRKISVRATEIETFQRQTVILPNSELINAAVGNWTHKNRLGRIEIPIGVSYDSDPRRVHAILTEIAKAHPLVLKNPEPFVLFGGFGGSSLDFEVRVFLADIMNSVIVQNDLRFTIFETFEREGIKIPFPQRDLNIRIADRDRLADKLADVAAPAPAPGKRRGKRPDPD